MFLSVRSETELKNLSEKLNLLLNENSQLKNNFESMRKMNHKLQSKIDTEISKDNKIDGLQLELSEVRKTDYKLFTIILKLIKKLQLF
jgi:hypothetical protein